MKSGLTSNIQTSGKSFTKDPTISTITQSVASADYNSGTFTGTSGHFGSYGGDVAGGGADANTKLLLNFDRTNNSIDFEDSSNTGGNGHKVTSVNGAKISTTVGAFNGTSSGKTNNSSAYFDGAGDDIRVDNPGWNLAGTFTIEMWVYFKFCF